MNLLQKTLITGFVVINISATAVSFALTNKETVIASIDTLNTSINTSISLKEKTLSDTASKLGNQYDSTIKSLGFQSDEVEALTSIKKLGVPSFRQDIAQAYQTLKQNMFQDIKASQTALTTLRDEVSLGYADLSAPQKQSYDAKIADIQGKYNSFLTGSTTSIDSFSNTFSLRITSDSELVKKMMNENGKYITFIRDIRSRYSRVDSGKTILLSKKDTLEKEVLPKVQNGFLVLAANKKLFTDIIRKDLINGLEKAMAQERIKRQETELRAYIEDIMSKWNEYLVKNFGQDDELVAITKDAENALATEKALRNRVYDASGNIISLDLSGSTVLADISKSDSEIANINTILASIVTKYSTGNTLSSLNDKLISSYKTELANYRADFTKLLEDKLSNALLEEKNHAQILSLIDQEEQILKQNLSTTTSALFTEELVKKFNTKIIALAKTDGKADTIKKTQVLSYKYLRAATQKKIDDTTLAPYYGIRTSLDITLDSLFLKLENKSGKEALLIKFPLISEKIDALLANTKLTPKKRYALLVVQSNILKYLEDGTK